MLPRGCRDDVQVVPLRVTVRSDGWLSVEFRQMDDLTLRTVLALMATG
ncbi:hypothetical protein [Vreelandella andesensis]|nr:hypothetical protein [Halomonas andesensis]